MWINHHHLLHNARTATAGLLWANADLLFFMSLIPFVTAYLGQHPLAAVPLAAYGASMALSSLGFLLVRWSLACQNRDDPARICFFGRIRL
jgi:uncharacterized membrane protein